MATKQRKHAFPSFKESLNPEICIFVKMRFLLCFSLFSVVMFTSCRKEATTWTSEFAAPIAYTTLDIGNIVGDTNLVVNPDSTINLYIEREVYRLVLDSLFETPDTTISEVHKITSPITLTVSPGFTFLSEPEETTYDIPGAELKYFMLKSGQLNYEILSYVDGPTIDSIIITSATKSGQVFKQDLFIPASDGITPVVVTGSVDLTDYEFDLTGSDGLKYNTLLSKISATLDPSFGSTVSISQADSIRINITFENISAKRALGYFGNELIEVTLDTISIPFMDRIINGTIDLDEIALDLIITDGIGVDKQINISEINSINGASSVPLTHSTIGSAINLTRPSKTGWIVTPEVRTETFTNATSNLDAFVENLPNEMSSTMQFQINPFGDINNHGDFFNEEYPLKADIILDMPLCFSASNLTLRDTINIATQQDTTQVKSGVLTINAINYFPFAAGFQLYLKDEFGTFNDSIVSNSSIDAAMVNALNEVIAPKNSQVILTLNETQIKTLIQTGEVMIQIVFETANSPTFIKIKDWHHIDLNLNAKVSYEFNLE